MRSEASSELHSENLDFVYVDPIVKSNLRGDLCDNEDSQARYRANAVEACRSCPQLKTYSYER